MKYAVVGLTDQELLKGQLSSIMNAIRRQSEESFGDIAQNSKKRYAQVFFENNLELAFYDKHENESEVLYINELAMWILDKRKVTVRILEAASDLPQDYGTALSLPIVTN